MQILTHVIFVLLALQGITSIWLDGQGYKGYDDCENNCKAKGYDPVCGSDRVTYFNQDTLNCKGSNIISYRGQCKPVNFDDCSNDSRPVCGEDNITYQNDCSRKSSSARKQYDGPCERKRFGFDDWNKNNSYYDRKDDISDAYLHWRGVENYGANDVNNYNTNDRKEIWYKPFNDRHGGCDNGDCDSERRCCNVQQKNCCMDSFGKCCGQISFPKTYNEPRWINENYEKNKGNWKCNRNDDTNTCKPQCSIPYEYINKPCGSSNCEKRQELECYLPPVPQSNNFDFEKYGREFPFGPGHFPDPSFVRQLLISGFNKPDRKIENDSDFSKCLFDDNDNNNKSSTASVKINIAIDVSVNINTNKKPFIDKNISKIPEQHKQIIRQYATLYYIFFFVLVQKNMVSIDCEVAFGYTVKDLLLFIAQDCWNLDFNDFSSGRGGAFDANLNFGQLTGQQNYKKNDNSDILSLLQGLNQNNQQSYGFNDYRDNRGWNSNGNSGLFVGSELK